MARPDKSFVNRVIEQKGRAAALRRAYERAWDTFEEKFEDRSWWRRKGTRAGLIWEYAVQYAIEELQDDVEVIEHFDTVSFIFDGAVLVRLKKGDFELKSRNYPTALAQLFHEPEADLFGFAGYQRVEVVYVLNQFETAIDWLCVVGREGNKILWHFELEATSAIVETLPLGDAPHASSTADLASLKKTIPDKTQADNENE